MSVSGGTISDLFSQGDVFYPMAVYSAFVLSRLWCHTMLGG